MDKVEKLADFLYHDFTTQKDTKESIRIGLKADSIFFPA